jgi:hypothetical protein
MLDDRRTSSRTVWCSDDMVSTSYATIRVHTGIPFINQALSSGLKDVGVDWAFRKAHDTSTMRRREQAPWSS